MKIFERITKRPALLNYYLRRSFYWPDTLPEVLDYWQQHNELPFLYGGDMVDRVSFGGTTYAPLPLKFEAGTANFVGAIGLGEAIRYLEQFDPAEIEAYERELLSYAAERLSAVDGLRIYGATPDKCAIVSFTVEGTHPYDVGMILDKLGIAVRTGQHCAEPVMTHYGVPGMCRASLAMYNTRGEIDALAAGVERAVRMLR